MINIINKKDCCGCSSCANICPKKCINMVSDSEGFLYPEVDKTKCVGCNLCVNSCPLVNKKSLKRTPVSYGGWNKDEEVRKRSSSGGVFHLLCKFVINKKGVVFGAAFDEKFDVYHTYADNINDCEKFKGSKYVQSVLGNSYSKAKEFLDEGRTVLFTGTPCQIAGLYSFLKKNYKNLITQDIVCHSVPSPKVWTAYKELIGERKQITDIQFRNKEKGWKNGTFEVLLDNDTIFSKPYSDTIYMKGFLNGLYSRPSCYDCKFANLNRMSDITLGDFWGVDTFYPELFDDKGTSIVLVNSKKGNKIFRIIKKGMKTKKVLLKKAIWYNPAVNGSLNMNPNRKLFFKDNSELNKKYLLYYKNEVNIIPGYKFSFFDKIKFKIYNILKCINK